MKYVVGLGNPGEKYCCTRHNVGFMIVEKAAQIAMNDYMSVAHDNGCLSKKVGRSCSDKWINKIFGSPKIGAKVGWKKCHNMMLCEVPSTTNPTCYIKPMTFMNLSGEIFDYLDGEVKPEDVLVIVDELYLPLGRMRFRSKGSAGGHNGLKSIEYSLASNKYHRLRVGVGSGSVEDDALEQEMDKNEGIIDFVLSRFEDDETCLLNKVIQKAAEGLHTWVKDGVLEAQQQYNGINLRF